MARGAGKGRKALITIGVLLLVFISIPLIAVGLSFIGRISPDSVIPDSFDFYARLPNPVRFFGRVLEHENLPEILALAELAPMMAQLSQLKNAGLTENKLLRFTAMGTLDVAFLPGGQLLAAWDAGMLSPVLKFLPVLAGRVTVPGLYYVKAGKNSRFEYRPEGGSTFFFGPYKNLLVISNTSSLYESVISGASRDGDRYGSTAKKFNTKDTDAALLLSPEVLLGAMNEADPQLLSAINLLRFSSPIEANLSVLPKQLKLRINAALETGSQALQRIIERNSQVTPLLSMVPDSSQYMTLLAAGNLKELFDSVSAIYAGRGSTDWENTLRRADSSSRVALGMSLEELLFSWTGSQFALYGLEGRPNPVIALQIKDEGRRKEVFDKAFKSLFVDENIQLILDGNRLPRIQVPDFLSSLLKLMDIQIPSPYYTVQDNYLFISESAETLLAAINSVRRNEVLPKHEIWRSLSEDNQGPSSFALYYSLDHSIPFFLKGSGAVLAVLKSYRQGLALLRLDNQVLELSLNIISALGRALVPVAGFPLDLGASAQGRAGRLLYSLSSGKDTRLLLTRADDVLSIDPLQRSIKELTVASPSGTGIFIIPENEGNSGESYAWIVSSQGLVDYVNKDLESSKNFPLNSGVQLSASPVFHGGKLYLPTEDASVHTVDARASLGRWGAFSSSPQRSPPFFFVFKNKTYAAAYPKSFFGEIFLLDEAGSTLRGWPVSISGIAFGSPLLFSAQYPPPLGTAKPSPTSEQLLTAFITQAGELSIYTENAETLPGFPLELPGVFYLQPVFDGEDLWIIESGGLLYRVQLDGEFLSLKVPRFSVKEDGYITVADINGDKTNEIIFSGDGNTLHAYSLNFSALEGFPLPVWGKPVFGDLNGDGKIEIAGIGMDNMIYMWQWR